MNHDASCELTHKNWRPVCQTDGCRIYLPAGGAHCHCGQRKAPLCEGCRCGMHLQHTRLAVGVNRPCICDLCSDEEAVA